MDPAEAYLAVSIVVLAIVAVLVFRTGRRRDASRLTPAAGAAFAFVVAGVLFGEARTIGYSLMGVGVLVAIADIVRGARTF